MDIMSDLPSFPRPGGAIEGVTTGIVEYKGKTHIVGNYTLIALISLHIFAVIVHKLLFKENLLKKIL